MDRRRMMVFAISVGILILVVVFLAARGTSRRSGHIQLPDANPGAADGQHGLEDENAALSVVDVTPETVQLAIEVMERPSMYSYSVTVETFWEGGSGITYSTVYVQDQFCRVDTQLPDGSIRHLLTAGEHTYVWYDEEKSYTTLATGDFSPDAEARIPTYEDILRLDADEISAADYGDYQETYCIYVTTEDSEGYTTQYWISTETGLLVACERSENGNAVYRMTAGSPTLTQLEDHTFLLPDGTEAKG